MIAASPPSRPPTTGRRRRTRAAIVGTLCSIAVAGAWLGAAPASAAVSAAPTGVTRVVSKSGIVDSTCGSGIVSTTPTYTTVQAAVNAAALAPGSGEVIYVCAGTYTENVTISEINTDLVGPNWNSPTYGSDAAILRPLVPALPVVSFTSTSTNNDGVRGFTIDGGTYGVLQNTADSCCWDGPTEGIVNNKLLNQTVAAIETRGLNSGNITGNTITPAAGADGIVLINQSGLMNVEANTITLSGDAVGITTKQDVAYGPTASSAANIGGPDPADGNTITGGTTAVLLQSLENETSATGRIVATLIQNNTMTGQSGNGIKLTDGTLTTNIWDNTIEDAGASAILLEGPTTTNGFDVRGTYIYRNQLIDPGRDGVEMTGNVWTTFVGNPVNSNGNTITSPGRDGVSADGFQTNTTTVQSGRTYSVGDTWVYYNTITDAGDDGVDLDDIQQTYVRYNTVTDPVGNGVEVDRAFIVWAEYNQVHGTGQNGLVGTDGWVLNVQYNTFSDGGADGIHLSDVENDLIWKNWVTDNADDGIELANGSSGYLIYFNTANNNGNGGIRLTGLTTPDPINFVYFNNVAGNGGLDCEDQNPGTQTVNGTYTGTTGSVWGIDANYGAANDLPVGICDGNTLKASSTILDGEVGNPYVGALPSVTNGTGPYTWSLPPNDDGSATLPAGLTLNASTGQITGTPTTAVVNFPVILRVTDAAGVVGQVAGRITIYPTLVASDGTVTGTTSSAITPFTPTVTGGNSATTRTFKVAPGSASALPAGLSLNTTTGQVTGTPSAPGTYTVTFHVTDNSPNMEDTASLPPGSIELPANADTYTVTFTITAGPLDAQGSFNNAMETQPYTSTAPTATGGVGGPYTWSTTSPLPAGLTLNPATGVISGTPATNTAGDYPITLKATDTAGNSDTFTATLKVLVFDPAVPMVDPGALAAMAVLAGIGALGVSGVRRRRAGRLA